MGYNNKFDSMKSLRVCYCRDSPTVWCLCAFSPHCPNLMCPLMWKRKKIDNFMCLLEYVCAKRLKAHSRAGFKYVFSNTNTNTNTSFQIFQIQIQIQIRWNFFFKYKYKYKYEHSNTNTNTNTFKILFKYKYRYSNTNTIFHPIHHYQHQS